MSADADPLVDPLYNRMWPLDMALGALGTFVGMIVVQRVSFQDPRVMYNAWTYLGGIVGGVILLDVLLRKVANRFVQRSMQLGFLISILVHLGMLTAALHLVIFNQLWSHEQQGPKQSPEPIRKIVPEYFFARHFNESKQPQDWEAPATATNESRSMPEPIRQEYEKPDVAQALEQPDLQPSPSAPSEAPLATKRDLPATMPVLVNEPKPLERQSALSTPEPQVSKADVPRIEAQMNVEPLASARPTELTTPLAETNAPQLKLADQVPDTRLEIAKNAPLHKKKMAADAPQLAAQDAARLDRAVPKVIAPPTPEAVVPLSAPSSSTNTESAPSPALRVTDRGRVTPSSGPPQSTPAIKGLATESSSSASLMSSFTEPPLGRKASVQGGHVFGEPTIATDHEGSPLARRSISGQGTRSRGPSTNSVVAVPSLSGVGSGESDGAGPVQRGTSELRQNAGTDANRIASVGLPRGIEEGATATRGIESGFPTARNRAPGATDKPDLAALLPSPSLQRRASGQVAPALQEKPQAAIPFQGRLRRTAGGAPTQAGSVGPEVEEAIEKGLKYLAGLQNASGSWSLKKADENVLLHSDSAATGLCLLSFQGAGYTHREHQYDEVVRRGLEWLISHQKPDGDLFRPEDEGSNRNVWLYSHGIAALALCEAYGMTQDPWLKEPAQRSIDFIIAAQNPSRGGWRYQPKESSDTSVSGWMIMAMKSAELAGLRVPRAGYTGVLKWLELSRTSGTQPYLFRYNPYAPDTDAQRHGLQVTPSMTAVGLLMQMYLGWRRDHPNLRKGADYLTAHLPDDGTKAAPARDSYYWYYATQVMFHIGGEHWQHWQGRLNPLLINSQVSSGSLEGSWDPEQPTMDRWSVHAGRLYLTTMNLLSLEIHYRHLPIYEETAR
jgi:hypothetical protein